VDISDPGVEREAHECVESGALRVIYSLNTAQSRKRSACEAEENALTVITVQDRYLHMHDNIKSSLSDVSPTRC
jgi:hypothetical protein